MKNKDNILNASLATEFSQKYLAYALSTITHRALPDVRDGLKPVHRRLLYAMYLLNLGSKLQPKKSARVVGDVIGKFHPHGDQSVYDALVRLAQDFSIRYPLVNGQGNFGNIDGDNAAAMRYTEAKLTEISELLLENIDEETVDFKSTYDGDLQEPLVFPAKFPNLLANGASGIAVGMATSIPPHNIVEICEALKIVNHDKNVSIKELLKVLPGPDFPTGGILNNNKSEILKAYTTGKGFFELRSSYKIEDLGRSQYQISINEIPYQVSKSTLIEKIADLIISKKNKLIDNVIDESDQLVRIVIRPKNRNVKPEVLMESLFRQTDLQVRIPLNMNVLNSKLQPKVMSIKEVLINFLSHRYEVLIRKSEFRLKNIKNRIEILIGFIKVYHNLDKIIKIIRNADDPKLQLIKKFKFTQNQVNAILDMRLRNLRKLEEKEIKQEYKDLLSEKNFLTKLLSSKSLQKKEIDNEVDFLIKKFKDDPLLGKRRTKLDKFGSVNEEIFDNEIKSDDPLTITIFKNGFIKSQKTFIKNLEEQIGNENIALLMHARSNDKIILVSNFGKFYTIEADNILTGSSTGRPISSYLTLTDNEKIIDSFKFDNEGEIFIYTKNGYGFIALEKSLETNKKTGKKVMNIKGDDTVVGISKVLKDADSAIIICDADGKNKMLAFNINEIPKLDKGRGVILVKGKSLKVVSATIFNSKSVIKDQIDKTLFDKSTIEDNYGKRAQSGKVIKNYKNQIMNRNFENNIRCHL
ncbi:MAG: DNA topoisomerase IV subunit A [Proteobacteria bacterium]|jgi:topoisomerase-4 subunit A|nr:DNA topoisomerase IV subunit A [Candidatus Fonsibacter sp. PEL5]NKA16391.1 DNA topoisomerase IV subunit A [Candidatus Fonsibacter sp. PEL55]